MVYFIQFHEIVLVRLQKRIRRHWEPSKLRCLNITGVKNICLFWQDCSFKNLVISISIFLILLGLSSFIYLESFLLSCHISPFPELIPKLFLSVKWGVLNLRFWSPFQLFPKTFHNTDPQHKVVTEIKHLFCKRCASCSKFKAPGQIRSLFLSSL